jgi:hypothetical protein
MQVTIMKSNHTALSALSESERREQVSRAK